MEYEFEGKVVAISGGSRGIGLAAGRRFVQAGASVALAGLHVNTVAAAVAELEELAAQTGSEGEILGVAVDLTEASGVQTFLDRTLERFGGVDILVNSAGNSGYGEFLDVTDEMAVDAWTLKTLTALRLTRSLVPIMEARGGGAIVNLGGGSGREPTGTSLPASLANAGLRVFTKSGAADLARRGIAINSVSPGWVHTDRHLNRARAAAEARGVPMEEVLREWAAIIPTGRTTTPEETAELILFLASRRVPNLIGAEIVLDGGEGHTV